MSGRKLDSKPISVPEVKKLMEEVKEKMEKIDAEEGMSHFQDITFDYVNKFAKISDQTARKIKKMLMEQYEMEETTAINIINIDPQRVQELRTILEKTKIGRSLSEDDLQEMLYKIEDIKVS